MQSTTASRKGNKNHNFDSDDNVIMKLEDGDLGCGLLDSLVDLEHGGELGDGGEVSMMSRTLEALFCLR